MREAGKRSAGERAAAAGGSLSLRQQPRIWPLSKLGSQDLAQASRLLAVPKQLLPGRWPSLAPRGGEGSGYSPCRDRSSKGARREPGEVIPGPQGARPPPAQLLVAAAEARAGPSVLWGPLGAPRSAARQQSSRRGWDPRTPHETSAAPAPPRSAKAELRRGASRARRRAPQRHGHHLALPQDPPALSAAGEPLPPTPRQLLGLQRAPPGSAPPTGPARSPGQPRLQRDAWRPTRRASAARSWRGPGHLCAVPPAAPHASASAGNPAAVALLAHGRAPLLLETTPGTSGVSPHPRRALGGTLPPPPS